MLHNTHQLQFFMSTDADCPYLPDKRERKLFTSLSPCTSEQVQNALSQQGFRRSQNIVYRPVCQNCAACLSARIPVDAFHISKSQKRIQNKNADIAYEVRQARATEEQFDLFEAYVKTRHRDGGMSDMTLFDYASMVDETNVPTRLIEYRRVINGRPAELVAVALTDVLEDGLSMVYSFFNPELSAQSLGTFMILNHIKLCQQANLPYLYLGYWVKGSSNMSYKIKFRPIELYYNGLWRRFHEFDKIEPELPNSQQVLFKALKTLSKDTQKQK